MGGQIGKKSAGRETIGQRMFAEVERLTADGTLSRLAAFEQVAKAMRRSVANVKMQYYRHAHRHGVRLHPRRQVARAPSIAGRRGSWPRCASSNDRCTSKRKRYGGYGKRVRRSRSYAGCSPEWPLAAHGAVVIGSDDMTDEEAMRWGILVILQASPGLKAEELAPRVIELVAQGEDEIVRRGRVVRERRHAH